MLETSGSATLAPRQACAVESGASKSGMVVNLVMTSSVLDLTDNTTCHLFTATSNINFFTINITTVAEGTILGEFHIFYKFSPYNELFQNNFSKMGF